MGKATTDDHNLIFVETWLEINSLDQGSKTLIILPRKSVEGSYHSPSVHQIIVGACHHQTFHTDQQNYQGGK